jgi:hypothetical protein
VKCVRSEFAADAGGIAHSQREGVHGPMPFMVCAGWTVYWWDETSLATSAAWFAAWDDGRRICQDNRNECAASWVFSRTGSLLMVFRHMFAQLRVDTRSPVGVRSDRQLNREVEQALARIRQ